MPRRIASSPPGEDGTASVELVAAVPFVLLAVLVAAQFGCTGYALWSAAIAARAGARASLVGRSAERAARRALPGPLRDGAAVEGDGPVSVRVPVPRILPGVPPLAVSAGAALEDDGG